MTATAHQAHSPEALTSAHIAGSTQGAHKSENGGVKKGRSHAERKLSRRQKQVASDFAQNIEKYKQLVGEARSLGDSNAGSNGFPKDPYLLAIQLMTKYGTEPFNQWDKELGTTLIALNNAIQSIQQEEQQAIKSIDQSIKSIAVSSSDDSSTQVKNSTSLTMYNQDLTQTQNKFSFMISALQSVLSGGSSNVQSTSKNVQTTLSTLNSIMGNLGQQINTAKLN